MTNRTQRLPALMTVLLIAAIAACTGPEQFANNADSTAKNVASSTTATEEVARSIDGKVAPSQQTQTNDSYLRFPTTLPTAEYRPSVPLATPTEFVAPAPAAPPPHPCPFQAKYELPCPKLTTEWIDPRGELMRIWASYGYSTSVGDPVFGPMLAHAGMLGPLYSLETAAVGEWNHDAGGFTAWLPEHISSGVTPQSKRHIAKQVQAAIYDRNSEIGRWIRSFAEMAEANQRGTGHQPYWDLLIRPYYYQGFGITNSRERAALANWNQMILEYQSQTHGRSGIADFGAFLASVGFMPIGADRDIDPPPATTQSEAPTPTDTPTRSASTQPLTGTILYDRPLTEWMSGDQGVGWFATTDDGLEIGVYADQGDMTLPAWTSRSDFADVSVSVEIRRTGAPAASDGCLATRFDVASGYYRLCMSGATGFVWADIKQLGDDGIWRTSYLMSLRPPPGSTKPTDWTTLQIITRDDQFWFMVNGTTLWTVEHTGREAGSAAVLVANSDARNEGVFEFRNLVVRSVE